VLSNIFFNQILRNSMNLFKLNQSKKSILCLVLFACLGATLWGQQVPQAINYQSIMRGSDGQPLMNMPINVRFSIKKTDLNGPSVYQESHNILTNGQGAVNLVIGFGTPISGSLNAIDWLASPHFLQVEVDPGSGYVNLGTTQFLSVPYAQVAGKVLNGGGGTGAPATNQIRDADQNTSIHTEQYPNENLIRVQVNGIEQWQFQGARFIPTNNAQSIYIGAETGKNTQPFGNKDNIFIGHLAGKDNMVGYANTFVGTYSGEQTTTEGNTFIGANTGRVNKEGYVNTFLGEAAGFSNTTGAANTFIGQVAGFACQNGAYNTFLGRGAGHDNTTGHHNVYIGRSNAFRNVDGHHNIYIGNLAGMRNTTGDNEMFIDTDTMFAAPLIYGHFVNRRVGINRKATTNAFEVQGSASKSTTGEWLGNSDVRLKKNIVAIEPNNALNQLLSLQGITYEWNDKVTETERPEGKQYGFTAQNIQNTFPELVKEDANGYLQTAYGTYDALTIEAIRALTRRLETLEAENKALQQKVQRLEGGK
jgi:Chaperone of endosialidase